MVKTELTMKTGKTNKEALDFLALLIANKAPRVPVAKRGNIDSTYHEIFASLALES
jgi:hypothetical protein